MELLVTIIILSLIFDYINGFHDAANSIATIVSTKVLTPLQAVLWAACFNFVAFFIAKYIIGDFGIADTVSKTVIKDFITLEIVKRRKNITKSKNITKQNDKIFFCCFADNLLTKRIFLQKFGNAFFITFLSFALIVHVAVIIIVIRFQKYNTVCLFIAKKSNSIICFLLQISKANNVAVCLNGIEYSVCS